MSCSQIWSIEKEKDRENEKVGDRPAKLNEKKSDRELEREIKKQRRHFLLEEQHEKFVASLRKMIRTQRKQVTIQIISSYFRPACENVYFTAQHGFEQADKIIPDHV